MAIPTLLATLAAIPLALVQSSFVEWAFHRFWLHRGWRPERWYVAHALVHHQLCKFGDTFRVADAEQEEGIDLPWWVGAVLAVAGTLPWAVAALAVWLTGWNGPVWAFVGSFAVTSALYRIAHDRVHRLMHRPEGGRIERTAAFRTLERRHHIHHARADSNLDVLFPLADQLLFTDLRDAPIPALTPTTARRLARRYSRFGRALEGAAPRRALLAEVPPNAAGPRVPAGEPEREPELAGRH
jgi:hypothetical protein